jgi:hypothetical protein
MAPERRCLVKVRRAFTHLEGLQREAGNWARAQIHRNHCRIEPDPASSDYSLIKTTANAAPVEPCSTLIGHCVQNLRSGLDHLVFALATKHSGRLGEEEARDCQFPMIGRADKLKGPGKRRSPVACVKHMIALPNALRGRQGSPRIASNCLAFLTGKKCTSSWAFGQMSMGAIAEHKLVMPFQEVVEGVTEAVAAVEPMARECWNQFVIRSRSAK